MKVLHKKLKKVNFFQKFIFYLTVIAFAVSLAYLIYGIAKLKGIETAIRIIVSIVFIIWLIIYTLFGLITMLTKHTKTFILLTFLTIIWCPVFIYGSYNLNKIIAKLNQMNHETVTYTVNLISLKNNTVDASSILGMVKASSDNTEGGTLAKELIDKKYKKYDILEFDDYEPMINALYKGETNAASISPLYEPMINALYKGEIAAAFVPGNYKSIFGKEDMFPNIAEETKVVDEYSKDMKNEDNELLLHSSAKDLTEPFTMLVMGVDSDRDGLTANQAFNGDTLIMITFNPSTLTATMFSIPRDMYVPIACNGNRYNKINSSAAYGSSCVIKTVEQLTGIKIDYYLKMNFKGVVDLVNAVGGVDVNVEEPDFAYPGHTKQEVCEQDSKRRLGADLVCMNIGPQTLNGEQALAYARCRHLYAISDIARNQHQQDIIEAIARKIKGLKSIEDFKKVFDAIANNLETNMTPEQIFSLYNVGKDMMLASGDNNQFAIVKTHLAYYNLNIFVDVDFYSSALGYYPGSLNAITKAMRVNLGKEAETPIKSFSISYNDKYEPVVIGKGITTGEKLTLMPNLTGYNESRARDWCSNNHVSCEFITANDPNPDGQILTQSVHDGILMKNVSKVTFTISNGQGAVKPKDNDDDDE